MRKFFCIWLRMKDDHDLNQWCVFYTKATAETVRATELEQRAECSQKNFLMHKK